MTRYLSIILLLTFCSPKKSKDSAQLYDARAHDVLTEALADTTDILPIGEAIIDNEQAAIEIAEVILFKIYGREKIESERPYKVSKVDGYWIISGTLPKGYKGGTFEIVINSKNCQIIKLAHYK